MTSLRLVADPGAPLPPWTRLAYRPCPGYLFSAAPEALCPVAVGPALMVASLGATGTPAVTRAGNPPRTTDTRVNPARINCSATRALLASSGQSQ